MTYQSSIAYLYGLQKFGIKFGLRKVSKLLARLGNPQKGLPCIHIAGTNGKGSTAAFISSILSKAGYRVGLYTSPHLISFTERIKINNREISKSDVIRLTSLLKNKSNDKDNITYFEIVTAMALLYFKEKKVDLSILEVGMGGRLDATNIVTPLLSVITNISKEHEFYLGNSLLKIANEKAGIIKKNSVLITGATQPKVLSLFKKRCRTKKTRYYQFGKDISYKLANHNYFHYYGLRNSLEGLNVGLLGEHQIKNAAIALASVEILRGKRYHIEDNAIYQGLSNVHWPGRLEVLKKSPIVVIDGAHNPAAMKNLKKVLFTEFNFRKLILVIGIMEDKDIRAMFKQIAPFAHKVILCEPNMDRAASTKIIAKRLQEWNVKYHQIKDVKEAVIYSLSMAHPKDLICITGSLFTVGEARRIFFT